MAITMEHAAMSDKQNTISTVAYLFRNFKFLLWIVSSTDEQLNIY